MKGLTLTQPWATLVAIGAKKWETRSWQTYYRGPILIHAAANFPKSAKVLCAQPVFEEPLMLSLRENKAGHFYIADVIKDKMPLGQIIAIGYLARCVRCPEVMDTLSFEERQFGHYTAIRYAWEIKDVVALRQPIRHKGILGLWNVDADLNNRVCQQLCMAEFKTIFGKRQL